jgi:hypothetical protein
MVDGWTSLRHQQASAATRLGGFLAIAGTCGLPLRRSAHVAAPCADYESAPTFTAVYGWSRIPLHRGVFGVSLLGAFAAGCGLRVAPALPRPAGLSSLSIACTSRAPATSPRYSTGRTSPHSPALNRLNLNSPASTRWSRERSSARARADAAPPNLSPPSPLAARPKSA